MTQLALSGVAVEFGATRILADVTCTVARGEKWGVIGRNGTGKTTLLQIVAGEIAPAAGTVARAGGLRFALMDQHRDFGGATTVWEAAAGAFAELLALERSLAEQASALAEAGDRSTPAMLSAYAADLERFEHGGGYTLAARVDAVLDGLGFDPDEARGRRLAELSGGERGRLGLARQLVAPADVLLLDEPTNHLDLETTRWLENHLRGLDAAVLVVSHDRAFLEAVVDHVLHLEAGTAASYAGGYTAFLRQRTERRIAQQRAFDRQARAIAAEEDFIRRNIAGGNSAQAKGRRRRLQRAERLSPPAGEAGAMALRLVAAERGGDQVLVAHDVSLAAGGRPLLSGFSARLGRGSVVGLVGTNGSGKSTLLRTIARERAPDGGTLRLPESVRLAHYRQDLAQVPAEVTLYDIVAGLRPHWGRGAIQSHLARFGFSGDLVHRRADTLSGGERARVALAMIMLSGANLLLLDEPTNHLDVESIEALEDALVAYDGTVVLVSHDRELLRAVTDHVWALHGGRITEYPAGFAEWEVVSREREDAAAVAAGESEMLRQTKERMDARRADEAQRGSRAVRREAERALAEAVDAVAACEARVAAIRTALEDPNLYLTSEGGRRAGTLGRELETALAELERAFTRWETAGLAAESSG